jgi:hypothetical protein
MIKIYSGILGIFAVVAIVAVSAYALFSDSVSMNGIVLGTATPGLEFSLDNSSFVKTMTIPSNAFAPLLPGEMDWGEFWLRNRSNGTSDKLDLNLKATLVGTPSGNWNLLKDAIQLRVCLFTSIPGYNCDEANATAWHTLATWNTNEITLPGNPLLQDAAAATHYTLVFRIPASYGNEIAGKEITGVNFVVTGTQVTP